MHRTRSAITLIDVLITLALFSVVALFVVPEYYQYFLRNDLNLAEETVRQMLHSAQVRAQSGEQGDAWGLYIPARRIFRGTSFFKRDPSYDEPFAISSTIVTSGLEEVAFSPLYGIPSATGVITLTALNGDVRDILVTDEGVLAGQAPIDLTGEAFVKVTFERIENRGDGSAENAVYVGMKALRYEEDEWIPLKAQTDNGLRFDVTGLAMQRGQGFIRVMNYGGLSPGGKELVDARITFQNALIERVENDLGENETEQPFDGNVNDGVGGDEVTVAPDRRSVLFQTRVTNAGDSILIYWKQDGSGWLR